MEDRTAPVTKADIHTLARRFDRVNEAMARQFDRVDEGLARILAILVKIDKTLSRTFPNHEKQIKTLPLKKRAE